MKAESFSISWVDLAVVALLVVGLWRGRKRGMSEELLDIIKWALIVAVAGFLYEPTGSYLAQVSFFSPLSCYVACYIGIALVIVILFSFVRKAVGAKLVGSDTFGSTEYYFGMMAGMFRYTCIVIVGMAFLNARYYSPEEIQASQKYQLDNYGSSFFVTLPDLQQEVFKRSFSGKLAAEYLKVVLIRPTSGEGRSLNEAGDLGRRRERSVNEVLDKRR
jgi:uncharacterized membrane protein required for colicin V production